MATSSTHAHGLLPDISFNFHLKPALDGMIRGALIVGFLGTALGGVVFEKIFGLPYGSGAQWSYAIAGSAVGVIWGFFSGGLRHH